MSTLNNLKTRYRNAKTQATKAKIMNTAQNILSPIDFNEFVKWQSAIMLQVR